MTSNKDIFSSFDETIKTRIKLGDGHLVNSLGKGIVTVVTKQNEKKKNIHDVYYVQGMKHNLLSVGQVNENGFKFKFKGHTYIIIDRPHNERVIEMIQKNKKRMFPLVMRNVKHSLSYAQFVTNSNETTLG